MKILTILISTILLFSACERKLIPDMEDDPYTTSIYFPSNNNPAWASASTDSLGWDSTHLPELYELLETSNTRAFLLLKDGKMVIEKYWDKDLLGQPFDMKSTWYWASAGKTLTTMLVGIAQQEGYLNIEEPSAKYLGEGWTSLTKEQEEAITIKNQLTMTSGLDDKGNSFCTDPECLQYLAAPGTRWSYHNGPYTLLDGVIEGATNQNFNNYFNTRLRDKIGMDGFWTYVDFNHIYFSTARSMARFGILMLAEGQWKSEAVLEDEAYFQASVTSSQDINPAYGYLWWLNGKSKLMYPGLQISFNKPLAGNAPSDMYAAMGKNGQLINVVPSQNVVMVRMGDNPDLALVPVNYQDDIWQILQKIIK